MIIPLLLLLFSNSLFATKEVVHYSKATQLREYHISPTDEDISNMRYIISTLGNKPLLKLKRYEKSLNNAGDKIDHLHPLHFWRVVFTNDDLTAGIHSIKRRKKVWKVFMKGMAESLQEAANRNNILQEHLTDFSTQVGVDIKYISMPIKKGDWENFARALLYHVSRGAGTGRYDQ